MHGHMNVKIVSKILRSLWGCDTEIKLQCREMKEEKSQKLLTYIEQGH